MGTFASKQGERPSAINSIDVGIVDVLEDMKKLLTQDMLGVRPTELCTCRDNDLKENKFIKSIAESTQIVEGRIQVRMPWNGEGPPKESNYDVAYKRMISSEKSFKKKDCLEIVESEVQKLLDQDFVVEIHPENANRDQPAVSLASDADQELLKSLFQNKTPDLSLKYILIQVYNQKGQQ